MKKVLTIGEILVEIMARKRGQLFKKTGDWLGPFASGAPAIFIDQVSKMGVSSAIMSCVGKDDFGTLNIERLHQDGVDISGVRILDNYPTGTAFVTYSHNGDRDFIFNIKHAACGQLAIDHINDHLLHQCQHLHIMGSSLFSFPIIDAIKHCAETVKLNGGTISFDPNIRKEMLTLPEMKDALYFVLEMTDIYLPSESEVSILCHYSDEDKAIKHFLKQGIKELIIKRGNRGASYYSSENEYHVKPFLIDEKDPTGAGDCFGATYIACKLLNFNTEKALLYANASGALAVNKHGPMEGTCTLEELEIFIKNYSNL